MTAMTAQSVQLLTSDQVLLRPRKAAADDEGLRLCSAGPAEVPPCEAVRASGTWLYREIQVKMLDGDSAMIVAMLASSRLTP